MKLQDELFAKKTSELQKLFGLKNQQIVSNWRRRNSIPAKYLLLYSQTIPTQAAQSQVDEEKENHTRSAA